MNGSQKFLLDFFVFCSSTIPSVVFSALLFAFIFFRFCFLFFSIFAHFALPLISVSSSFLFVRSLPLLCHFSVFIFIFFLLVVLFLFFSRVSHRSSSVVRRLSSTQNISRNRQQLHMWGCPVHEFLRVLKVVEPSWAEPPRLAAGPGVVRHQRLFWVRCFFFFFFFSIQWELCIPGLREAKRMSHSRTEEVRRLFLEKLHRRNDLAGSRDYRHSDPAIAAGTAVAVLADLYICCGAGIY